MGRKLLGILIFALGMGLLALIWTYGRSEDCEHDATMILKGTFADCEARAPLLPRAPDGVLARRE